MPPEKTLIESTLLLAASSAVDSVSKYVVVNADGTSRSLTWEEVIRALDSAAAMMRSARRS
jgi:hypothetical protein